MVLTEEVDEAVVGTAERIGRVDFEVRRSAGSPDLEQRHAERADALAAWLLAQWHREHQQWENN